MKHGVIYGPGLFVRGFWRDCTCVLRDPGDRLVRVQCCVVNRKISLHRNELDRDVIFTR